MKQIAPEIATLPDWPVPSDAQSLDYLTGAWAPGECRDYHVCIEVPQPLPVTELTAARVSVIASSPGGEQVLGHGVIRATWT